VEESSATTENGKTISLNGKHQETIALTADTKYWAIVKWDVKVTVRDFQGKLTGGLD